MSAGELEARLARVDGAGALEEFLRSRPFPIVEGRRVTFVWRGEADEVRLRHFIHGLAASQAFERRTEGVWTLTLDLPEESRVEYKIEVVRGGASELVQDPFNPNLARDPYGANSVVHGSGYVRPDWTLPDPEVRAGRIEERPFASEAFGDVRPVRIFTPARFRRTRRYPLVVMHDGEDFLRYSSLETVLNNLIHRLEIPPVIVALLDSPARLEEYADDERHARFLADELVPLLESEYPLLAEPAGRVLVGASFGAVATLAAASRRPGVFGNLFLLSGSFAFTDIGDHGRGEVFDPVVRFVNEFRAAPGRPSDRVYVSCGVYESLIYYNRSLVPLLQSTGMAVRFDEVRDGHNWENWRDRMRTGLSWLLPGPLWLVYE